MLVSEVNEYETRLLVYIDLRNINFLFGPRYLIIHSRFLMNNHEYLNKLYSNDLKNKNKLIVDVDFCIASKYKRNIIC
ncbi:putative LRR containing protein [Trachipleistophora hominis]|uniref:Putative LRR containing protein n=1 Tax=Trachipleistophora hominis TaxID=72359 RepID=L7JXD7_TRAHO|nr:putative LRR containing protein [Trachipleistophora hominis]